MSKIELLAQTTVEVPQQLRVVTDSFDVDQVTGTDLVLAGISLLVGLVLARFVRRAVRRLVAGPSDLVGPGADLAGRLAGYSVMLLALVIAFEFVGLTLGPVLTVLVIIGLVAFLALRPLFQNLGAGIILQAVLRSSRAIRSRATRSAARSAR